jgi:hypothetical protein
MLTNLYALEVCTHTSTLRASSLGSLDPDFGAGLSSSAAAGTLLLRAGIGFCVGWMLSEIAHVVVERSEAMGG